MESTGRACLKFWALGTMGSWGHGEVTWVGGLLIEVSSFSALCPRQGHQTRACNLLWHLYEVEPNLPDQSPVCCKGKMCRGLLRSSRLTVMGWKKTEPLQKRPLQLAPAVSHVGKPAPACCQRPRVAGGVASPPLSPFTRACTGAWQV